MFKKSLKSKIIFASVASLAVLTIVLVSYMILKFSFYDNFLANERITASANSLKFQLDNFKARSRIAAISMAGNTKAVEAIKKRDKDEILKIFTPMQTLYRVNFYTITDNKGIVIARTHEANYFDDSILKQQSVKDALNGKISSNFEEGSVAKVSVRTAAPVYDAKGNLIGTIVSGIRFDTEKIVDELKELLRADVSIFLKDTRITTTILNDAKRISGTKLNSDIAKTVIENKNIYFGNADIIDNNYKAFYFPLINANNETFAVIGVGNSTSELKSEIIVLIRNVLIISFTGLLIIAITLYFVISSINRPLVLLSKNMDEIEAGNLNVVVKINNSDEIGRISKSLFKIVDTIRNLINNINSTISEHKKGNIDYYFNTNIFRGDYKLLADSIVELSNIGMRDPLTGLPNRRTFDNRLELEWLRAARDKTALSLLMLDIDKFKFYNDTYGHQQGDVVLQTVAGILIKMLKRGVDFAARWGGEEFAVLLPNTNSSGALYVAEQIRSEIEKTDVPSLDGKCSKRITVSVGIHTQKPAAGSKIKTLIAKTDAALYNAKEMGRNRICRYENFE